MAAVAAETGLAVIACCEAIGHKRGHDGDLFRVLANDSLCHSDEEVDSSGHLHCRCSHDNREHDEQYFAGDIRWGDIEAKDKYEQTHRAPQPQSDTAHACSHRNRAEEDEKFEGQSPV